jgi:hypothetical protein
VALASLAGLALPAGTQARERAWSAISPEELARRVFDEPWRVRVVDLRATVECAERRVPGAECVPEADLPRLALEGASAERDLVLVGAADLAAPPAAAAGFPGRILLLAGGWKGWEAFALAAPVPPPPGASPEEREVFRVRAGLQSALTGVKAAPLPPAPIAAPAGGAVRRGGGGCSG